MGFFDIASSLIQSKSDEMKENERKNIRRKSDSELEDLYRYYLDEDTPNHWQAVLIREEMARRGLRIPR